MENTTITDCDQDILAMAERTKVRAERFAEGSDSYNFFMAVAADFEAAAYA